MILTDLDCAFSSTGLSTKSSSYEAVAVCVLIPQSPAVNLDNACASVTTIDMRDIGFHRYLILCQGSHWQWCSRY